MIFRLKCSNHNCNNLYLAKVDVISDMICPKCGHLGVFPVDRVNTKGLAEYRLKIPLECVKTLSQ